MYEKRKNSNKRMGISLGFAIAFVLAGIFVGMNLNDGVGDNAIIEEARIIDVDLSGEWIGTTTQDYNNNEHYDYRIVIEQDSNNQISGMGYLDMIEDYEVYAAERLEGYVEGSTLVFSEVETVVLENATMDGWCHTQSTLTYQNINGQETLVGDWEYILGEERCDGITGRIILTRQSD